MDKVKIKRVKKNKKKVTTAEKIMAGVGVGSTLLGGSGAVAAKTQEKPSFVRSNTADKNGQGRTFKEVLGKVFGNTVRVKKARAADMTRQEALEIANRLNKVGRTPEEEALYQLALDVYFGRATAPSPTNPAEPDPYTPIPTQPSGAPNTQGFGSETLTKADGTVFKKSTEDIILPGGVNLGKVAYLDGQLYDEQGRVLDPWTVGTQYYQEIVAVFGQGGQQDGSGEGPWRPITTGATEGQTRQNPAGYTEIFYQGNWIIANGQTIDGSRIGREAGINYGSEGGVWILLDNQTKTDSAGFRYGSLSGSWVLLDGQRKSEGGKNYISSGGQWTEEATAETGPVGPAEHDTRPNSAGYTEVYYQGRWIPQNGQTIDGSRIGEVAGASYGSQGGRWILLDGQTKDGSLIGREAGINYGSLSGNWVMLDGQESPSHPGQISSGGQWVAKPSSYTAPAVGETSPDGSSVWNGQAWALKTRLDTTGGRSVHQEYNVNTQTYADAPREGDTKPGNDGTEVFRNGRWVLWGGTLVRNPNGFWYLADGNGDWTLKDGQTTTEGGVTFISQNGQWVPQATTPPVNINYTPSSPVGEVAFDLASLQNSTATGAEFEALKNRVLAQIDDWEREQIASLNTWRNTSLRESQFDSAIAPQLDSEYDQKVREIQAKADHARALVFAIQPRAAEPTGPKIGDTRNVNDGIEVYKGNGVWHLRPGTRLLNGNGLYYYTDGNDNWTVDTNQAGTGEVSGRVLNTAYGVSSYDENKTYTFANNSWTAKSAPPPAQGTGTDSTPYEVFSVPSPLSPQASAVAAYVGQDASGNSIGSVVYLIANLSRTGQDAGYRAIDGSGNPVVLSQATIDQILARARATGVAMPGQTPVQTPPTLATRVFNPDYGIYLDETSPGNWTPSANQAGTGEVSGRVLNTAYGVSSYDENKTYTFANNSWTAKPDSEPIETGPKIGDTRNVNDGIEVYKGNGVWHLRPGTRLLNGNGLYYYTDGNDNWTVDTNQAGARSVSGSLLAQHFSGDFESGRTYTFTGGQWVMDQPPGGGGDVVVTARRVDREGRVNTDASKNIFSQTLVNGQWVYDNNQEVSGAALEYSGAAAKLTFILTVSESGTPALSLKPGQELLGSDLNFTDGRATLRFIISQTSQGLSASPVDGQTYSSGGVTYLAQGGQFVAQHPASETAREGATRAKADGSIEAFHNGAWGPPRADDYFQGGGGEWYKYDGSRWVPMARDISEVQGTRVGETITVSAGVIKVWNGTAWRDPQSGDVFTDQSGTIFDFTGGRWVARTAAREGDTRGGSDGKVEVFRDGVWTSDENKFREGDAFTDGSGLVYKWSPASRKWEVQTITDYTTLPAGTRVLETRAVGPGKIVVWNGTVWVDGRIGDTFTDQAGNKYVINGAGQLVSQSSGQAVVTRNADGSVTVKMGDLEFTGTTLQGIQAQLQAAYANFLAGRAGGIDLNAYNAMTSALQTFNSGIIRLSEGQALGTLYSQGATRIFKDAAGVYTIYITTNEPVYNPQTGATGYNLVLTGSSTQELETALRQVMQDSRNALSGFTADVFDNASWSIRDFQSREARGELRFTFEKRPEGNIIFYPTLATANALVDLLKANGFADARVDSVGEGANQQYIISVNGGRYQGSAGLMAVVMQNSGADEFINMVRTEIAQGKNEFSYHLGTGTGGVLGDADPSGQSLPAIVYRTGDGTLRLGNSLTGTIAASPGIRFVLGNMTGAVWSVSSGSLPPGVMLESSSGALLGAPTSAGSYSFTIRATVGSGATARSVTQSFNMAITASSTQTPAGPASISTNSLPNAVRGSAYSQTLTAVNLTRPVWLVTAGSLPAGLSINNVTGAITGTPTIAGIFNFTVMATDSVNGITSASKPLSITVTASQSSNNLVTMTPGTVGVQYSRRLAFEDASPTWTRESGALPPGLQLSANGTVSGIPTTAGTYTFTLRATEGAATGLYDVTLVISPAAVATAMEVDNSSVTGWTGQIGQQNIGVTVTGRNLTGATLSAASGSGLTISDVVVNAAGTQLTAKISVSSGAAVGDRILTLSRSGSAGVAIRFAVMAQAAAPAITTTAITDAIAGQAYTFQLAASNVTNPGWSITSGRLPAGLTLSPFGVISGTPTDYAGPYRVTVRVTGSGNATASKEFTLVLKAVIDSLPENTGSITTTALSAGIVGRDYSQTLASSGITNPGWNLASGQLPPGLVLSPLGRISGVPSQAGTFSFTVRVSGSGNVSAAKQMTILVTSGQENTNQVVPNPETETLSSQRPAAESATVLRAGTVGQLYTIPFNWPGHDGAVWSIASGSLPPGITLSSAGLFSGIPTAAGTYNFTIRATKGSAVGTQNFTLTINQPSQSAAPAITTLALPAAAVGVSYRAALNGVNITETGWSLVSGSLSPGITLLPSGSIAGTPTAPGTYNFTAKATGINGGSVTKQLSLVVAAAPQTDTETVDVDEDIDSANATVEEEENPPDSVSAQIGSQNPAGPPISINQNLQVNTGPGQQAVQNVSITSVRAYTDAGADAGTVLRPGYTVEIGGTGLSAFSHFGLVTGGGQEIVIERSVISENKITLTIPAANLAAATPVRIALISNRAGVQSGLITINYSYSNPQIQSSAVQVQSPAGVTFSPESSAETPDIESAEHEGVDADEHGETADIEGTGGSQEDSDLEDDGEGMDLEDDGEGMDLEDDGEGMDLEDDANVEYSQGSGYNPNIYNQASGGFNNYANSFSGSADAGSSISSAAGSNTGNTNQTETPDIETEETAASGSGNSSTGSNSAANSSAAAANISALQAQLDQLQKDKAALQAQITALTSQLSSAGNSNTAGLQTQINQLNSQNQQLQNQIQSLLGNINSYSVATTRGSGSFSQVAGSTSTAASQSAVTTADLRMPGYDSQGNANTNRPAGLAMPPGYRASGGAGQENNPYGFSVGRDSGGQTSGAGLQMPAGYAASGGSQAAQGSGAVAGQSAQVTYTVKKGDTLWSIAKKYYGTGTKWRKILSANPKALAKAGNTKTLKVGAVLVIPELSEAGAVKTSGLSQGGAQPAIRVSDTGSGSSASSSASVQASQPPQTQNANGSAAGTGQQPAVQNSDSAAQAGGQQTILHEPEEESDLEDE